MVYGRAETSLTLGGHAALHRRRRAMPWQEQTEMSLKREFVRLAEAPDANLSALCRRLGPALAHAARLPAPHRPGPGGGGAGDPGRPPALGWAQDRADAAEPRCGRRPARQHLHRHPAPPRPARPARGAAASVAAVRGRAPQRPVATRLQGPRAGGRRPLPPAERARRPLPLRGRARRLRRRARRHGAGPPDRPLPALRDAVGDPDRQRPALGQPPPRPALHRLELLADPARDRGAARAALPPPDPGQGRALPPHAQGRAARHHAAARSPHRATALRRLARRLQPRPTARRAGPGDPDRPLPRPPRALVPRSAAADRLRRGRDRADPARRGQLTFRRATYFVTSALAGQPVAL